MNIQFFKSLAIEFKDNHKAMAILQNCSIMEFIRELPDYNRDYQICIEKYKLSLQDFEREYIIQAFSDLENRTELKEFVNDLIVSETDKQLIYNTSRFVFSSEDKRVAPVAVEKLGFKVIPFSHFKSTNDFLVAHKAIAKEIMLDSRVKWYNHNDWLKAHEHV